jgi:hypothetical protein
MKAVAAIALVMALPQLLMSPELVVVGWFAAALLALVLLNLLVEMVFGIQCPACSRWTLRRLARHRYYYRCSSCRARFKRLEFGRWLDASGPEDAERYRLKSEARPWQGFAVPEDLDATTSGHLLQGKRSRAQPVDESRPPTPPGPPRRLDEARQKVGTVLRRWRDLRELPAEKTKPPDDVPGDFGPR